MSETASTPMDDLAKLPKEKLLDGNIHQIKHGMNCSDRARRHMYELTRIRRIS
jgi:hypothetical protein